MITKQKLMLICMLGIISGFALMISGNTLNFWLSKENINVKTIGVFALISLPYSINFLWAPIFDTKKIPIIEKLLGHRVSWILFIQIFLAISVYLMSTVSPSKDLMFVLIYGVMIAFFASAQDSILGAIRTEMVSQSQQGEISGIYILGYRIGMLMSGSFAIYASQYLGWNLVYKIFSITIISFSMFLLCCSKHLSIETKSEMESSNDYKLIQFFKSTVLFSKIISPIGHIKYIILVLIFLILYRLPDNFITIMINPFLLHIGYNEFEIATAGKLFGLVSVIIGGLIASHIMKTKNIYDSLLLFGSIHAIAHIFFIVHEFYGKNLYLFYLVTGFESISGGMSMAAYIAFIASLCKGKFRATQYSFLSSMMGLSRSVFPIISGCMVNSWGWSVFYIFTTIATIPSLMLIFFLKRYDNNKIT